MAYIVRRCPDEVVVWVGALCGNSVREIQFHNQPSKRPHSWEVAENPARLHQSYYNTHTNMHKHTHTYAHAHAHAYTHTHKYAQTHTYKHTHTHMVLSDIRDTSSTFSLLWQHPYETHRCCSEDVACPSVPLVTRPPTNRKPGTVMYH